MWWAACGRYDLVVRAEAFWATALGGEKVTADRLRQMHPLRSVEARPEPAAARTARESNEAWKLVDAFFTQKR